MSEEPEAKAPGDLEAEHAPAAVRRRLLRARRPSFLGDAVLGAIDGGVTSFAIVSAAAGGGLSGGAVVIMGLANVLADGLSMAVSNAQAKNSERELIDKARRSEARHIDLIPEGEREEIRQIFALKGFEGAMLEDIVAVVTRDRELWIDTMLTEELGLPREAPEPTRAGLATFGAFAAAGLVPLIPYLILDPTASVCFALSAALTAALFLAVGVAKGRLTGASPLRSGLTTLAAGGGAAAAAYLVGALLKRAYGLA